MMVILTGVTSLVIGINIGILVGQRVQMKPREDK